MAIHIMIGDVTKMQVDCVVNAANDALVAGAGVCGAIFDAAGYQELTAACDAIGGCPTGSAVITPGFRLPARYIIHAVGPVWVDGRRGEPLALSGCYRRSLELMAENGCGSIAFPLISSGIYGYPKEKAWEQALSACRDFLRENEEKEPEIYFAVLKSEMKELGESVLKRLEESTGNTPNPKTLKILGIYSCSFDEENRGFSLLADVNNGLCAMVFRADDGSQEVAMHAHVEFWKKWRPYDWSPEYLKPVPDWVVTEAENVLNSCVPGYPLGNLRKTLEHKQRLGEINYDYTREYLPILKNRR